MIRTLIVDDEPLAHKVLEGYCSKIHKIQHVGNCYDGISTINFLSENKVDLVLLDIQMPDLNGVELLSSLHESPKIIFTTAFSEYAIEGYNYEQVVDYLLKPIPFARFIKAINKLDKILTLESFADNIQTSITQPEKVDYINLKEGAKVFRLLLEHIVYLQSWGNYIKVFLENGEMKMFRMTFKEILTMLPEKMFQQVHKSYIVNLSYIKTLERHQLVTKDTIIPIGKSYSILIRKALNQ